MGIRDILNLRERDTCGDLLIIRDKKNGGIAFRERFSESKVIMLERNFRSKKPIVQNSQQVIAHDPASIPPLGSQTTMCNTNWTVGGSVLQECFGMLVYQLH
jgi:hypothetical protein